jgi:phosphopantothenoylcysteine synthetase/decarboxylase
MGAEDNQITLVGADGSIDELPLMSKEAAAAQVLGRVVDLLEGE